MCLIIVALDPCSYQGRSRTIAQQHIQKTQLFQRSHLGKGLRAVYIKRLEQFGERSCASIDILIQRAAVRTQYVKHSKGKHNNQNSDFDVDVIVLASARALVRLWSKTL